jgi:CRISPR/Cas system CMR-associated protein Cmr3 (group 5 of RAMP superfamily)
MGNLCKFLALTRLTETFLEELIEIKSVFVGGNSRFWRFSKTNEIHSCAFDRVRMWEGKASNDVLFWNLKTVSW